MRIPYECSDQDGLVREKWSVSCLIKHSLCEQPRHLQDFPTGQVFGVRFYTKLSIDSVRFESTTMLIISEVYTISVLIVRLFITPTCATKSMVAICSDAWLSWCEHDWHHCAQLRTSQMMTPCPSAIQTSGGERQLDLSQNDIPE